MMPTTFAALQCLAAAAASAATAPSAGANAHPEIEQRLRTVDVAAQPGEVYALEVMAAPKLTTNIRLPEGFVPGDVLCGGACIDAADVQNGAQGEAANWVIEKRAQQQSIHVWPARLPGPGNPTSAFATNIYVATDDGKAYNITLKLLDLNAGQRSADAVVNIVNSAAPSRGARAASLQQQCREQARQELHHEARSALYAGLNGPVVCRKVGWSRPHRDGLLLVRLEQLCHTKSAQPLLWAYFSLENRSAGPLQIDSVRLEPGSSSFQGESDDASTLSAPLVLGKQSISGVAIRSFRTPSQALRGWRLEVVPEPNASAGTIAVDNINF